MSPLDRLRARAAQDPLWRAVGLLDVRWRRVASAVALGSLALGSAIGLAAVAAWLIARASQMPPVLTLSVAVVSVRAFGISRGVFRYLERLASHDVALRGMSALRTNLYSALASGRSATLVGLRRGDLLARVGADVDAVGDLVVRSLIPAGVAAVVSLGSVVLIGAFLPWAGVALACCLALAGVLAPWLSARAARTIEVRGAAARSAMTSTALEILESSGPLAVSGRMASNTESLRASDRDLAAVNDDGARTAGLSAALTTGAIGLAVLASLLLGIPAVEAGALAPVELSVIVLTPLAVFEAAGALPAAAVQLHRSREAARRVMELVDGTGSGAVTGGRAGSGAHSGPGVHPDAPPGAAARSGVELLPEVATAAPTRSRETADAAGPRLDLASVACGWATSGPVVAGIDLSLAPGRAVALVGPSGVGKTTLLMTAAGLLPAVAGEVALDGVRIAGLPADDLPHRVVFVAEDGHVFDTTVLENLRVGRGDVAPEEAVRVLGEVGLAEWLSALPHGVETTLGPDATTVSGGERRRLLVARALLAPAPLLLVDEPAEHLDAETADALVRHLVGITRSDGRGVVVATHRLTALDRMDEVLLLGPSITPEGPARVVARGTHRELIDLPEYRWALDQESVV